MEDGLLEWIKVVGPLIISWPIIGLLAIILFRKPLTELIKRFKESSGGKAEIGGLFKIDMGTPILPPQYKKATKEEDFEKIDMSQDIGEIRDQGPEGSVVGFSVAYAMQAAIKAKSNEVVVLSPRSIYNAAKEIDKSPIDIDTGAHLTSALRAVKETGAYLESDWPYANKMKPKPKTKPAYKILSYQKLIKIEDILNEMKQDKVVIVGITATEEFMSSDAAKSGKIVTRLPLKIIGGHSVCLVGYDGKEAEFKFANSWSKNWGANGFGFIRDSDLSRVLSDAYTLEL